MARVSKRSQLTATDIQMIEAVGEDIVSKAGAVPFDIDGAIMSTVKYADGTFKKKTLSANCSFFIAYAYVGADGNLIFGLSPEDIHEYEFVEMKAAELDTAFPLMGSAIGDLFEVSEENLRIVIERLVKNKVKEAIEGDLEAEKSYANNPNFGRF